VPLHNFRLKAVGVLLTLAIVGVSSCRRPSGVNGDATPQYVPVIPQSAAQPSPEEVNTEAKLGLAAAVAGILDNAHRTGSIVEHCSCVARGRVSEAHAVEASFKFEPMEQALAEITHRFPEISWRETPQKVIRVSDSRKLPGLLSVRIQEFLVIEDRPPQAALPALWRKAEVSAYMHRHNIHPAHGTSGSATVRKTAPTVIQVKNATVAEILDRIVAGYRSEDNVSTYHLWVYRECRSGAETFVEIRVQ
jgi:hypothetical protein